MICCMKELLQQEHDPPNTIVFMLLPCLHVLKMKLYFFFNTRALEEFMQLVHRHLQNIGKYKTSVWVEKLSVWLLVSSVKQTEINVRFNINFSLLQEVLALCICCNLSMDYANSPTHLCASTSISCEAAGWSFCVSWHIAPSLLGSWNFASTFRAGDGRETVSDLRSESSLKPEWNNALYVYLGRGSTAHKLVS